MKLFSKATQMMKSLYTPFGSLIAIIVFLLVVIAVLRLTGVTVGLGANAHVGRLHGSFALEGFEEHASTPDPETTAAKYRGEVERYFVNIKNAWKAYYDASQTGYAGNATDDKAAALKKYTDNLNNLTGVIGKIGTLKTNVTSNQTTAGTNYDTLNTLSTKVGNSDSESSTDASASYVSQALSTTYRIS